ncbi:MAG: transporter [Betaproteobacteria bacterium RBG_16_56_24]|nr:MAG: transporter [Betaproteobacteria bacterium RBG_16_56_24]
MDYFRKYLSGYCAASLAALCAAWLSPAYALEEHKLGANLPGLLEYAREHNPEFAAMRHEADAAAQRVQPAAALPDPVFRTELMDITNQGMDKSASLLPSQVGSTRYTLMQSVPWMGKRGLKHGVAEAGADQARGRTAATWAELAMQIKSAYAQYHYVAASQTITRDLLDLMVQMGEVARARYANGLAAQQDAVRSQVEQTVMKTGLVELDNARRQIEARLNALLSRPANMPLATPERLRSIPATASLENHAALENLVREHNPDLFVDEAGIRASEKNRDLVYKNRYPDFALGVSPTQSGATVSEWGVMLELNIPLQQETRRSQERESEAMLAAAKARKEATANRILSALTENLSGLDAAQRTGLLSSSSLLPQAKVTFESALTGYQTGRVDFATLLDAARQILNARLEILKAQTDAQMRLAEVERLLGEEL